MPPPRLSTFDSPCRGVCRIDERLGWCIGCQRTRMEIACWSTASDQLRQSILAQLPSRQASEADILAALVPVSP